MNRLPDASPDPEWIALDCNGTTVLCVDHAASGPANGTEQSPCRIVQDANGAAPDGPVIQVARGTYQDNVLIDVKGVEVYGGFPAAATSRLATSPPTRRSSTATGWLGRYRDEREQAGVRWLHDPQRRRSVRYRSLRRSGLYVEVSGHDRISHNLITGNNMKHPSNGGARGGGKAAWGRVTIYENRIIGNRSERGAGILGQGELTITENSIEDNVAWPAVA